MALKVTYKGELISVNQVSKLSGLPTTSLYRAYHLGLRTGEELIAEVEKHLVEYEGKKITVRKLCKITKSDYRTVKKRLEENVPVEEAILDLVECGGGNKTVKLSPSQVLSIYSALFKKEKTQLSIADEYNVHQTTVNAIWNHGTWDWITAPLRFELENDNQ